jgi:hypothetical protein
MYRMIINDHQRMKCLINNIRIINVMEMHVAYLQHSVVLVHGAEPVWGSVKARTDPIV